MLKICLCSRFAAGLHVTLVVLFCFGLAAAAESARAEAPNVIFILADDLGWGDLSCHGSSFIKTPHLDRLAAEGTDFRQFYTASPVCSPSRVGFMTGKFPARFGVRSAISGVRKNAELPQVDWLDPRATMLPRLMKESGYATGHFGKWHLQSGQAADAPLPAAYGVDEVGLFAGTSHPNAKAKIADHDVWKAAMEFVSRHKDHRFFMNVWCHETHLAHYPTEASLAANKGLDERQRIYAAVATDADQGVGQIMAKLRELSLDEKTLVVFSSDNGPENTHPTQNEMRGGYGGFYSLGETGGHKGRKRSLHDGGVRTPFIVRWPGRVPAGRVNDKTVLSATDLLPTVCAAAGIALPGSYAGDGENMLSAWLGQEPARAKPIFWDWTGTDKPVTNWPRWAVRVGDWKLITDGADRVELYHMSRDPREEVNVAADNLELVSELREKLAQWKKSLPETPPAECVSKVRARGRPAADE